MFETEAPELVTAFAAAAQPVQHPGRFQLHEPAGDAAHTNAGGAGDPRIRRIEAVAGLIQEIEDQRMEHGKAVAAKGAVLAIRPPGPALEIAGTVPEPGRGLFRGRLKPHLGRGAVAPDRPGGIGLRRCT